MAFSLVVVSCRDFAALGTGLGLALTAAAAARLAVGATLRRLLAVDLFVVLVILMLPFTTPGETVFRLGGLEASREGLLASAAIALKANAVVVMLLALVGTQDAAQLGRALKRLGLPDNLIHLLLFMVRYVGVLEREYHRLRQAMRARAFRAHSDLHTWRSLGYLLGMLLVRSFDRSERVLAAMKCRGFDGRVRLADGAAFGRADILFALAGSAALAVIVLLEAT